MKLIELLKSEFEDIQGELEVVASGTRTFIVKGKLYTKHTEEEIKEVISQLLRSKNPMVFISFDLTLNNGLSVLTNKEFASPNPERNLDDINIIYSGLIDVSLLKQENKFKLQSFKYDAIRKVIKVTQFITPIVLDRGLKVIDGDERLSAAIENGIEQVHCVITDADEVKADFLRLVLNRSSEFQRWTFQTVDPYVDATPQAQPLLEPLGFFGLKVLPTSFFSDTILKYEIDEYNPQMMAYKQEAGLHNWAAIQRERIAKEAEHKANAKKKVVASPKSMFDLSPKPEDFVETYNIKEEMENHQKKMRVVAQNITNTFDEIRRPELEAKGVWQNNRRTTAEKAADIRAEAESQFDTEEE